MATRAEDLETGEPEEETRFEIEPSDLDEASHSETLILYRDSQHNIRFAKGLQWKTMGGTLAIFALTGLAAHTGKHSDGFIKTLIVLSMAVSAGSTYAICILQSWQNTEREKLRRIIPEFSNLFRSIYRMKSRTEANIHRYILLAFMVITILIGNYVMASTLTPLYQS